ncbi:hypothetical protein Celal_3484 [Cellulophaga algicola DSM 14237]|uniref:DUF4270 domain-containing protein n=1 Tax=Cellulophaga algicola (strain DSM 14237 / IC166 / ACAM 630) TaxID=688270 RepID=E6X7N8_CELAD|nr:DUF4270 family protein [Cellulophaga algicola]ADV50748.1 hypothetical protein Celal_3484 [Cellulophaga algicola DSM 14237]
MINKLWVFSTIILLGLLGSCSDDTNDSDFLAGDLFTDSNIRVVLIDTLTVNISTIKFDSIITSAAERILIGQYTDPVFGKVRSANYSGFLPNSYYIDTEAEYDSIVLFAKYDTYYYNDTTKTNTIKIKRLSDNFDPDENNVFYNNSTVAYDDIDLGIISYIPRPQSSDSLEIKLTDDLGLEFFNQFQNKIVTDNAEFTNEFKGLALLPDTEDDGSVIGFSKSSSDFYMRLYYSTAGEIERTQSYTDIILNTSDSPNPFFNNISATDPINYLQTLTNGEVSLSSDDSDDESFIQSGTGIATKIELPYLKTVNNVGGQGTLLKAVLKIKPVAGSYSDYLMLREYLSVYLVDKNNDITSQLYNTDASVVSAILNTYNQEYNDVYFEIDLTAYIEGILSTDLNSEESLLLIPENYTATVDRFILNGTLNSSTKTKLELTYAVYDEEN